MSDNNSTLIEKLESIAYSAGDERQTRIIELDDVLDIIRQYDAQTKASDHIGDDNEMVERVAKAIDDTACFDMDRHHSFDGIDERTVFANLDEIAKAAIAAINRTRDDI